MPVRITQNEVNVTYMNVEQLLTFMRHERYATQASASLDGVPQAAIVGIAVSDRFELIFDTIATSRKMTNLRTNPKVAFVIGPQNSEQTVQYEGFSDEPSGAELDRLLAFYYERFPDGPERRSWPGLTYVRVTPTWIRYSDFTADPPEIIEFRKEDLYSSSSTAP
jgi:general stress protein 26